MLTLSTVAFYDPPYYTPMQYIEIIIIIVIFFFFSFFFFFLVVKMKTCTGKNLIFFLFLLKT